MLKLVALILLLIATQVNAASVIVHNAEPKYEYQLVKVYHASGKTTTEICKVVQENQND